jgi:hypothetical protein
MPTNTRSFVLLLLLLLVPRLALAEGKGTSATTAPQAKAAPTATTTQTPGATPSTAATSTTAAATGQTPTPTATPQTAPTPNASTTTTPPSSTTTASPTATTSPSTTTSVPTTTGSPNTPASPSTTPSPTTGAPLEFAWTWEQSAPLPTWRMDLTRTVKSATAPLSVPLTLAACPLDLGDPDDAAQARAARADGAGEPPNPTADRGPGRQPHLSGPREPDDVLRHHGLPGRRRL